MCRARGRRGATLLLAAAALVAVIALASTGPTPPERVPTAGDVLATLDEYADFDEAFADDPAYAGFWLDQRSGQIAVAFTAPPTAAEASLLADLAAPGGLQTRVVRRSLRQLEVVRHQVDADMLNHVQPLPGVEIIESGIRYTSNHETVGIHNTAPAGAELALYLCYGDGVVISRGEYAQPASGDVEAN